MKTEQALAVRILDRLAAGADEDAFEAGTGSEQGKTSGKTIPSVSVLAKPWYGYSARTATPRKRLATQHSYAGNIYAMVYAMVIHHSENVYGNTDTP